MAALAVVALPSARAPGEARRVADDIAVGLVTLRTVGDRPMPPADATGAPLRVTGDAVERLRMPAGRQARPHCIGVTGETDARHPPPPTSSSPRAARTRARFVPSTALPCRSRCACSAVRARKATESCLQGSSHNRARFPRVGIPHDFEASHATYDREPASVPKDVGDAAKELAAQSDGCGASHHPLRPGHGSRHRLAQSRLRQISRRARHPARARRRAGGRRVSEDAARSRHVRALPHAARRGARRPRAQGQALRRAGAAAPRTTRRASRW